MVRFLLWFMCSLLATPSVSDTVFATRTIRAHAIIGPNDLTLKDVAVSGGISEPDQVIGMEARVALYAGRPIRLGDIAPPAMIERNQIIPLIFTKAGITISTDGRALSRGGIGDRVRVMNMASRNTVIGVVQPDGSVNVSN
jgi:flagella basal body P-ring formation protein FlgA